MWVSSASGFVWSMNCESCEEPKNSFTTADTGLALMRSCGMRLVMSEMDIRSFTARSIRVRPDPELVLQQLADRPHPPVAEMVDVVGGLGPELHLQEVADHAHRMSSVRRVLRLRSALISSFLLIMKRPTRARS